MQDENSSRIPYVQSGRYNTMYRVLLGTYMQSPNYDIDNLAMAEKQGDQVEVTRILKDIQENLLKYLDQFEDIHGSIETGSSLRSRAMHMASFTAACKLVEDIDALEPLEKFLS